MKLLQLAAVAAIALPVNLAFAQDGIDAPAIYPMLSGEILVELGYDNTFSSDDSAAELGDLYPTVEATFDLRFNRYFLIHTDLILEPVLDPTGDRAFEDIGLYAETLYLQYQMNAFSILAGKFNPGFGTAWDITPGVFGTDLAEDYEISERIGFGAGYAFGSEGSGVHKLQANVFFADTTFLSDSVGTRRGRTTLSSGGASNTESLNSFSLTLDGSDFDALPGFAYHLGFSHQAAGIGNTDDENGIVFGLQREIEFADESRLLLIGEIAHLQNAAAGPNDVTYATVGLGYNFGHWNTALSTTYRWTDMPAAADQTDFQIQGSVGYEFENGIALDVGYKFNEEGGVENHTVGFRLGKTFNLPGS